MILIGVLRTRAALIYYQDPPDAGEGRKSQVPAFAIFDLITLSKR